MMVDTDYTYIQVVEPRETYLDPLGYEISDDIAIRYIDLLLKLEKDEAEYRLGTYDEINLSAHQAYLEKTSHKKVECFMKKDLSKAGMTEDESQIVREIMRQGVLNIQPLLVLVSKETLE